MHWKQCITSLVASKDDFTLLARVHIWQKYGVIATQGIDFRVYRTDAEDIHRVSAKLILRAFSRKGSLSQSRYFIISVSSCGKVRVLDTLWQEDLDGKIPTLED